MWIVSGVFGGVFWRGIVCCGEYFLMEKCSQVLIWMQRSNRSGDIFGADMYNMKAFVTMKRFAKNKFPTISIYFYTMFGMHVLSLKHILSRLCRVKSCTLYMIKGHNALTAELSYSYNVCMVSRERIEIVRFQLKTICIQKLKIGFKSIGETKLENELIMKIIALFCTLFLRRSWY